MERTGWLYTSLVFMLIYPEPVSVNRYVESCKSRAGLRAGHPDDQLPGLLFNFMKKRQRPSR